MPLYHSFREKLLHAGQTAVFHVFRKLMCSNCLYETDLLCWIMLHEKDLLMMRLSNDIVTPSVSLSYHRPRSRLWGTKQKYNKKGKKKRKGSASRQDGMQLWESLVFLCVFFFFTSCCVRVQKVENMCLLLWYYREFFTLCLIRDWDRRRDRDSWDVESMKRYMFFVSSTDKHSFNDCVIHYILYSVAEETDSDLSLWMFENGTKKKSWAVVILT